MMFYLSIFRSVSTMNKVKYEMTFEDGSDAYPELKKFSEIIGLEKIASNRFSMLLLMQLYGAFNSGFLNPAKVVHQIEMLEGIGDKTGLKPATEFTKEKLKGLWHQHYMGSDMRSLAFNIRKGLNTYGMPWVKEKINDTSIPEEERFFTEKDASEIAKDIVFNNYMKLKSENLLTGEWIIFAKHEGDNYYLCLGKHDQGDDVIRNEIDSICTYEFPFLKNLLT